MNWRLFEQEVIKLSMASESQPKGEQPDMLKSPTTRPGDPTPPQPLPSANVTPKPVSLKGSTSPVITDPTKQVASLSPTWSSVAKATGIPKVARGVLARALRRVFGAGASKAVESVAAKKRGLKATSLYRWGLPIAGVAAGLHYGGRMAQNERDLDQMRRAGLIVDDRPTIESTQLNTEF